MFTTRDPTTGEPLADYTAHDESAVSERLDRAATLFDRWRARPIERRTQLVARVGDQLRANTTEYATRITSEMGKPLPQATAEIEKCAWLCDHYAERAPAYLQDERIGTEPGVRSLVTYEPLGPVVGIMPWNYPFWQVFRFAIPAIVAGNVALCKHSPTTMGCGEAIADCFERAGVPDGVFQTLRIETDDVAGVIEDDAVAGVTLTGSTEAGRAVGATAGRELKRTVLELGGSDPFVVLDDADVPAAVRAAVRGRTQNSGQSCIAAKRLFVHTACIEPFCDAFVSRMANLTVGDPTAETTDVGPLARPDLLERLHEQVERTVAAGADLACGGSRADRPGNFYEPTVLLDPPADAPACREEVFGPVAVVSEVPDEQTAVERANDTSYGLSASVWTDDRGRGERVVRAIRAGAGFVNSISKSDPRLPFGGVGDSGVGTELGGPGVREFTNRKTLWIE